MRPVIGFKMGKAENQYCSRGKRFFGPIKWHEAPAKGHFGAQKIMDTSKRRDFLKGHIEKPITGRIQWFGRVDFTKQRHNYPPHLPFWISKLYCT